MRWKYNSCKESKFGTTPLLWAASWDIISLSNSALGGGSAQLHTIRCSLVDEKVKCVILNHVLLFSIGGMKVTDLVVFSALAECLKDAFGTRFYYPN